MLLVNIISVLKCSGCGVVFIWCVSILIVLIMVLLRLVEGLWGW